MLMYKHGIILECLENSITTINKHQAKDSDKLALVKLDSESIKRIKDCEKEYRGKNQGDPEEIIPKGTFRSIKEDEGIYECKIRNSGAEISYYAIKRVDLNKVDNVFTGRRQLSQPTEQRLWLFAARQIENKSEDDILSALSGLKEPFRHIPFQNLIGAYRNSVKIFDFARPNGNLKNIYENFGYIYIVAIRDYPVIIYKQVDRGNVKKISGNSDIMTYLTNNKKLRHSQRAKEVITEIETFCAQYLEEKIDNIETGDLIKTKMETEDLREIEEPTKKTMEIECSKETADSIETEDPVKIGDPIENGGKFYIPTKTLISINPQSRLRADRLDNIRFAFILIKKTTTETEENEETKKLMELIEEYPDSLVTLTELATIKVLDDIINCQINYLSTTKSENKKYQLLEEWQGFLETANTELNKFAHLITLSLATRIYEYEFDIGKLYYIKNTTEKFEGYNGFIQREKEKEIAGTLKPKDFNAIYPLKHSLKPFPSHDFRTVKKALADWQESPLIRKKKKKYENSDKSILLEGQPPNSRKSDCYATTMRNEIKAGGHVAWLDIEYFSAYNATSQTLKSPEGLDFFNKYIAQCNPNINGTISYPYKPLLRTKQEWCHLIAHADGGDSFYTNLVAGSYSSNTLECAIESAIRSHKAYFKTTKTSESLTQKNAIKLKATAYLIPCGDHPHERYNEGIKTCGILKYIYQKELENLQEENPSVIRKDTIYEYIFNPQSIKAGVPEEIAPHIFEYAKSLQIPCSSAQTIIEYYQSGEPQRKGKKQTSNLLRAVFDSLCGYYYLSLHVAAFVRYVITVGETLAIDYVVDGQREEIDRNEFMLTTVLIKEHLNKAYVKNGNAALKTTQSLVTESMSKSTFGKRSSTKLAQDDKLEIKTKKNKVLKI